MLSYQAQKHHRYVLVLFLQHCCIYDKLQSGLLSKLFQITVNLEHSNFRLSKLFCRHKKSLTLCKQKIRLCQEPESNRHGRLNCRGILSPLCLPIPPSWRCFLIIHNICFHFKCFFAMFSFVQQIEPGSSFSAFFAAHSVPC